jgi:hypothetical protein
MKTFLILSTALLSLNSFANTESVYEKSAKSYVHEGKAFTQVVLVGNKAYIEMENENGYSCSFQGMYIKSNNTSDIYSGMNDSSDKCEVSITHNNDSVSINHNDKCNNSCGSNAELEVYGISKIK